MTKFTTIDELLEEMPKEFVLAVHRNFVSLMAARLEENHDKLRALEAEILRLKGGGDE